MLESFLVSQVLLYTGQGTGVAGSQEKVRMGNSAFLSREFL